MPSYENSMLTYVSLSCILINNSNFVRVTLAITLWCYVIVIPSPLRCALVYVLGISLCSI